MPSRLLFLLLGALLTGCRSDLSQEQQQTEVSTAVDTVEITAYDVSRENSPALSDWQAYETGKEVIAVPPGWKSYLNEQSQDLILTPADSSDRNERLVFTRYQKDSPTMDYDRLGQKLAQAAFGNFRLVTKDTLKKVELQRDFCYERNASLHQGKTKYQGYCLVYINEQFVYKYTLVLAQSRLDSYSGDLLQDLIGNLQIENKHAFGNENPVRRIIYIKSGG